MVNLQNFVPISLIALAVLVRWLVAQFPYSGQKKPPLFGDYEAQRHWMEVTTNLPIQEWYTNSTNNDLSYWGLDYPPLTAYHMYLFGEISKQFNSSWTELHESRGIETYAHKIFMRATVIISDLLVYIPAVVYYFYKTQPLRYTYPPSTVHRHNIAVYTALTLLYPGQILIDHGHFQYNCIFMGLVLWAVIALLKGKQATAALLFTFALNYKQMSLYYSLPFFWFLASYNLRVRPLWKGFRNILLIGFVVTMTFILMFLPYLHSKESISQVMKRIFPFYRGVFEDKVANFWFSLSIFYKFRKIYSTEELLSFSTILTLLVSLPAGLHLLLRPTIRTFKYALANTSMAFFLLSFQVHEKTILVPALPILLLFREHPMAANWFVIVSTFSLQPLLLKDGQLIPYLVLMMIYTFISLEFFRGQVTLCLSRIFTFSNLSIVLYLTSILGCFIFSVLSIVIEPPPRYPDIHPTVNALYSCLHFMSFLLFFYYRQFTTEPKREPTADRIYLIKKTK